MKIDKYIAVGLDGTLAEWEQKTGPGYIGKVVPKMKELILEKIMDGNTVKIFTPRAADPDEVTLVKKWLGENGFPDLEVTNVRTYGMLEFYDARCTRVILNSGVIFREEELKTMQREVENERTNVRRRAAGKGELKYKEQEPKESDADIEGNVDFAHLEERTRELKRDRDRANREKLRKKLPEEVWLPRPGEKLSYPGAVMFKPRELSPAEYEELSRMAEAAYKEGLKPKVGEE